MNKQLIDIIKENAIMLELIYEVGKHKALQSEDASRYLDAFEECIQVYFKGRRGGMTHQELIDEVKE